MSTDAQNVRRCWSETLWPSGCAQTWMKNGDLTLENSRGFSTWICKACCLADCCRVTTAGVETEPDGGAAAGVITFCGHCGSCSWHGIDGWSARRFKLHWDVLQRNAESLMMRRCWWPDERCTLAYFSITRPNMSRTCFQSRISSWPSTMISVVRLLAVAALSCRFDPKPLGRKGGVLHRYWPSTSAQWSKRKHCSWNLQKEAQH